MAEHAALTEDAEQMLLDAEISDAEMERRRALLERIERSQDAMIARRGGKPIDVAVVDALLNAGACSCRGMIAIDVRLTLTQDR